MIHDKENKGFSLSVLLIELQKKFFFQDVYDELAIRADDSYVNNVSRSTRWTIYPSDSRYS